MSIRLNANTDRAIRTASAPAYTHSSAFTFMGWFKIVNNTATYTSFIVLGTSPNLKTIGPGSNGTTLIYYNGVAEVGSYALSVGTWYHIAYTQAADNTTRVYVDGTLRITGTDTNDPTASNFQFGNDDVNEWLDGEVRGARSWTAELTAGEIASELASTTVVKTASLWADWDLPNAADAGSDRSGNSRPLTFTSIVDGASDPSIYTGSSPTLDQEGFRFRNDDGSETTATWLAAQDANASQVLDTNTRIRFLINVANTPAAKNFRLDYKKSTDAVYLPMLTAAPSFPTVQAVGTAVNGIAAVSPAWPTHAIDDIALLFIESCGGEPATLSTAAGFAAVANSPQATGATTTGTQLTVFWCRATSAAMSAPTVADPGNHVHAVIITYRGCIAEGNPVNISGGGVKGTASTSVSMTGVTTTVDNCLLVYACSNDLDATAAVMSAQADANLASITEQYDAGTTQGNGGGLSITTGTLATAGASGTMTATVTSSINAFMAIALMPPSTHLMIAASSNITAGGEATTFQLAAPATKATSDFDTGRMWDDENGTDALTITVDNYTEIEWCFKALAAKGAVNGNVYDLRVTNAGAALDTYGVSAQLTIGSGGGGLPFFMQRDLKNGYIGSKSGGFN